MICSSLCRVPFIAVLLSWVWEKSHCRWISFRGLGQVHRTLVAYGSAQYPVRVRAFNPGLWTFTSSAWYSWGWSAGGELNESV